MTEETKKKISLALKGRMPKNISLLNSPEVKKKSGLGKKRKPFSGTHSNWNGKKHSEKSKQKMSKSHKGKKMSIETRRKVSENLKGDKSHLWKGGITQINKKIRNCLEYRLWRESVFKRDNYSCVWCGAKNGMGKKIILNADHIKPFAYYPELRFAIDNGRTLCHPCHKLTDTYGCSLIKNKDNPRCEVSRCE